MPQSQAWLPKFENMSPSSRDLLKAALLLSEVERIVLAKKLIDSVASASADAEWAASWQREASRRWRELESGAVQPASWADVEGNLQQMIDQFGND